MENQSSRLTLINDFNDNKNEFREFCLAEEKLRQDPGNHAVIVEHCEAGSDFQEESLVTVFSLCVILCFGIFVRLILKKVNLPYTVVVLVGGVGLGQLAVYTELSFLCPYLEVGKISPDLVLYTFLPLLIFESAFYINTHVFTKCALQIIITAFPGMLMSTFLTATVCMYMFSKYSWSFVESSLFGSIVSATDPVAVVSILRELGASESLSVLIEGESLLNDGVAVVLFEIFHDILEESSGLEVESYGEKLSDTPQLDMLKIFVKFCQISLGGPVFGYICGKLGIFALSKVYNDAIVEISITLSAAYLTYFIGENMLGVSGILAVVVLGLTLNSNSATAISPEVEKPMKHFWEMMTFLANTVLFFICGLIIGLRAFRQIHLLDWFYLLALFVCIMGIRFGMLIVLSPILKRLGYGYSWHEVLVMTWGGLRGAVGLCLALEVFENPAFCHQPLLGAKILFHTAGIVLLTLVINATSTKKLMQLLKMTTISETRKAAMASALKILNKKRFRYLYAMVTSELGEYDSNYIFEATKIKNPYDSSQSQEESEAPFDAFLKKESNLKSRSRLMLQNILEASSIRKDFSEVDSDEMAKVPSKSARNSFFTKDLKYTYMQRDFLETARICVLRIIKASFRQQCHQGLIKGSTLRILIGICNRAEDHEFKMISSDDLKKFWDSQTLIMAHAVANSNENEENPHDDVLSSIQVHSAIPGQHNNEAPSQLPTISSWRLYPNFIVSQKWFHLLMNICILLALSVNVAEVYTITKEFDQCPLHQRIFIPINLFFVLLFAIELALKVWAFGYELFFNNFWSYIEALSLVLTLVELIVSILPCRQLFVIFRCLGFLRIVRLAEIIRIFKFSSQALEYIETRHMEKVFLGYEVGKAFVSAVDHVAKLMPCMAYPVYEGMMIKKILLSLERQKRKVIRDLGALQTKYPEITLSAKTKHASSTVINNMKIVLNELIKDGLIEEPESGLLETQLQKLLKMLSGIPDALEVPHPEMALNNLDWFRYNANGPELLKILTEKAELQNFVPGDFLYRYGQGPFGIFVVVTGLIRVEFLATVKIKQDRRMYGMLPNSELYSDLKFNANACDLFGSGSVIGELGYLKGDPRAARVTAETYVTAYFISNALLDELADEDFMLRLWTSVGFKVASELLKRDHRFDHWTAEQKKGYLERSVAPWIGQNMLMEIPEYVSDVAVIEGHFEDFDTGEIYVAPCLVPRHATTLYSKRNPMTSNKLLLIPYEDISPETYKALTEPKNSISLSFVSRNLGSVDTPRLSGQNDSTDASQKGNGRPNIRQRRQSIAIQSAKILP